MTWKTRVLRPAGSCIASSRASDPDSRGRTSLGLRASFSRDTGKEAGIAPPTWSCITERDGLAKAGTRVSVCSGELGEIPRAEGARAAEERHLRRTGLHFGIRRRKSQLCECAKCCSDALQICALYDCSLKYVHYRIIKYAHHMIVDDGSLACIFLCLITCLLVCLFFGLRQALR